MLTLPAQASCPFSFETTAILAQEPVHTPKYILVSDVSSCSVQCTATYPGCVMAQTSLKLVAQTAAIRAKIKQRWLSSEGS